MKLMKKTGIYKASNVEFNPETCEATSYNWWHFVRKINGKVVFNHYNYSPSTVKHLYKVRELLGKLNIEIDLVVSTSMSLSKEEDALNDAINELKTQIVEIETMLQNSRRKKALDNERLEQIEMKKDKIQEIKKVITPIKLQRALA